jgi:hypothetical protein
MVVTVTSRRGNARDFAHDFIQGTSGLSHAVVGGVVVAGAVRISVAAAPEFLAGAALAGLGLGIASVFFWGVDRWQARSAPSVRGSGKRSTPYNRTAGS